MDLLQGRIQNYAWGSKTAIAELLGNPSPAERPEAELWLGAHPSAPSLVLRNGVWTSLVDVIAKSPENELGAAIVARFGARLPFLLKVLAAETPLSLQAHPNLAQARAGFAAEEAAGVPRDAPHRNYKDADHKPELICALGTFWAFSGFRRAADTVRMIEAIGASTLLVHAAELRHAPNSTGIRALYARLTSEGEANRRALVDSTLAACAAHRDRGGEFARECSWALELGALYPSDIGVVLALLLNLVELSPGDGIYLSAGNLHAYLRGVGIEIMANSDNVLRGGLTPKHVDPPELLRVLTFADDRIPVLRPTGTGAEKPYDTPAPEFRLSRIELGGAALSIEERRGAEILLCTAGRLSARAAGNHSLELTQGAAAYVPASDGTYVLGGTGTIFRATAGLA
ncbi:MAG: mannose-6-phosphate isomerase, class I [Polyangiaceae bacterium]